jgi:hypothetical protein
MLHFAGLPGRAEQDGGRAQLAGGMHAAMMNSTRFAVMTATRLPAETPCAARCRAKALLPWSSWRNDQRSSPAHMASLSPNRSAARSSCSWIVPGTETFFSYLRSAVNIWWM